MQFSVRTQDILQRWKEIEWIVIDVNVLTSINTYKYPQVS